MPNVARVYRAFKPKNPNYDDEYVLQWLRAEGDTEKYDKYMVVPRSVLISRKALSRYNKPCVLAPDVRDEYVQCSDWLYREFHCMKGSVCTSYDDLLTNHLDPSKKPGYPWCLKYIDKQAYWIGPDANFFNKYWDSLETERPIQPFAMAFIKEELRETEKVLDNNARTVVAIDVNHLVAHSFFVMDQNIRLKNACLDDNASALGLNLFHGGADRLYHYMCPWGDICCLLSIDGKKFDSSFFPLAFDLIYELRYNFLSTNWRIPVNRVRLFELKKQIYEGLIVDIDGSVYYHWTGNLSGQASTTPDNILKNFMDFVYHYKRNVPPELRTYEKFKELTRLAIVGDDVLLSVHPSIQKYFNKVSINRTAPEIGMVYEFEHDEFKRFRDISFIGHRFKLMKIPGTDLEMYFPDIDCQKMRCSMVRFSTEKTLAYSIIRCCGLRNETFACESCRNWFSSLFDFLVSQIPRPHTWAIKQALKNHLTDAELWSQYSGLTSAHICRFGVVPRPINTFSDSI